jgi:PAS domain S-box-containing protein
MSPSPVPVPESHPDCLCLDLLDEAILLIDTDQRVVWINRPLERLLDVDRDALLGTDAELFVRRFMASRISEESCRARILTSLTDPNGLPSLACTIRPFRSGYRTVLFSNRFICDEPFQGMRLIRLQPVQGGAGDLKTGMADPRGLNQTRLKSAEEFQVTNEELEVGNEELRTQTDDLQNLSTELHRQKRLLDSILSTLPHHVSIWDADGRLHWMNERMAVALGKTPDGLVGMTSREIGLESSFMETFMGEVGEVIATAKPITRAVAYPDGVQWREYTIMPLRNPDGTVTSALFVSHDITGRMRIEDALRESEQRFRSVLENSLDAAYRRNLQTDRYDYVSPVIEQITGISVEEMCNADINTVLARIHPEDLQAVQQVIEGTQAACEATGRGIATIEYRFMGKDGAYRWLADQHTVLADNDGRPLYRLGIVRDITERRRVEAEVRRRNEHLTVLNKVIGVSASSTTLNELLEEALLTTLDLLEFDIGGIYMLDREHRKAVLQYHQQVPDHYLMQKRALNIQHWPYNYVFMAGQAKYIESDEDMSPIEQDMLADLTVGSLAFIPLMVESTVVGALMIGSSTEGGISEEIRLLLEAICRDIGAGILRGMLYNRLESANREANLYLDILTHDIRNADNVANMYADLLLDRLEGEEQAYVRKLKGSIRKSIEILANVSTIRKIHQEKAQIKPIDLHWVILEEMAHFPDAVIHYGGMPMEVWADDLLTEIFANLIGNAVKYGGPGVQVTITVEESSEDDETALVTVADNGPGVPNEAKEAIFLRFEREKSQGSGQGLGLSICRLLVERYGGRIWVEDRVLGQPGEGAAFKIVLREVLHNATDPPARDPST